MNPHEKTILRAIYDRSHALSQKNASLDDVAQDVGMRAPHLYEDCRVLRDHGLLMMHARFSC